MLIRNLEHYDFDSFEQNLSDAKKSTKKTVKPAARKVAKKVASGASAWKRRPKGSNSPVTRKTNTSRRHLNKTYASMGALDSRVVEFSDYNNLQIQDGVTYKYVGKHISDNRRQDRDISSMKSTGKVVEFDDYNTLRIQDGVTYKYVGRPLNDKVRSYGRPSEGRVVEFDDYSTLRIQDGVTYKYVGRPLNDNFDNELDDCYDSASKVVEFDDYNTLRIQDGVTYKYVGRPLNDNFDNEFDNDDHYDNDSEVVEFDDYNTLRIQDGVTYKYVGRPLNDNFNRRQKTSTEKVVEFDDYNTLRIQDGVTYKYVGRPLNDGYSRSDEDSTSYDGELTRYNINDSVMHLPQYSKELVSSVEGYAREIASKYKINFKITDLIGLNVKDKIKLGGKLFSIYNGLEAKQRAEAEILLNNIWESFTAFLRKVGSITEKTALEVNKKDLTLFVQLSEELYYPIQLINLNDKDLNHWAERIHKEFNALLHYDGKNDDSVLSLSKLPHGLKFK